MSADVGNRHRTLRKNYSSSVDISGAVALGFYEKTIQMLSEEADTALMRPWHKLDRGLRIGRLRDFVKREAMRLTLSTEDSDALFKLLMKALDRKLLNSKASVTYDTESQSITEIKGLVSHTTAVGQTKYSILDKKPTTTLRRRSLPPAAKDNTTSNSSAPKNEVTQPQA
jgi:hypothetical protein